MAELSDLELYYFNEGTSVEAYRSLGCHATSQNGFDMRRFAVWAPNAKAVSVVGDWNSWRLGADPMRLVGTSGVWQCFVGIASAGNRYKYAIVGADNTLVYKADPYALRSEQGGTASVIEDEHDYPWTDGACLEGCGGSHSKPMNIYEVHLGSWKKGLSYRELAHELVDYAVDMHFTHLELMPCMAYPFNPSWGYQVTGYFCPTSRYGSPDDLKYLVNRAHERGLGVIMDWVPAHFTRDAYGLARFDGTPLYEHPDPRRSDMRQWGTLLFDYGRTQVQSFLVSNAVYWLSEFHMDGLRVDAVSCMLYLDFGREDGDWLPNADGGRENYDAIRLLHKICDAAHALPGNKLVIAEESTAFPQVTNKDGPGLGFDYKWNMGWMNDMLSYMQMDSLYRKWHHDKLTFSLMYAFSEHFVLPFSHDEVVHGKLSMLNKMPGDYWQKFAQLRLLYGYMMAHPGKKLSFMGMELGQFIEWKFDESLDWILLGYPKHAELHDFAREMNRVYISYPPLYERDDDWEGFRWINPDDAMHSILSFARTDRSGGILLCCFNFTPVPWDDYRMGAPVAGRYKQILNTDEKRFGGTGDFLMDELCTVDEIWDRFNQRITVKLPPYSAVFLELTERYTDNSTERMTRE